MGAAGARVRVETRRIGSARAGAGAPEAQAVNRPVATAAELVRAQVMEDSMVWELGVEGREGREGRVGEGRSDINAGNE